jgi:hypothetical protein
MNKHYKRGLAFVFLLIVRALAVWAAVRHLHGGGAAEADVASNPNTPFTVIDVADLTINAPRRQKQRAAGKRRNVQPHQHTANNRRKQTGNTMKKLIALAMLCLPLFAHATIDTDTDAACQTNLSRWMKALHPGRQLDNEHAACKVWPADPSLMLAVLPMPQAGASDDEATYDVEVLLVDRRSGAIVAHSLQPSAITSDAIGLSSIEFDTARYQLTPQLRAFGVRVTYEGSSRVDPYEAQVLSLYVRDGGALRRVLADMVVSNSTGEWDGNCAGTFSSTTRTLAVGPADDSGFATLRIGEVSKETVARQTGHDCVSTDGVPKRSTTTLNYNGTAYSVPKVLHYE